jgi:hypothetical protein
MGVLPRKINQEMIPEDYITQYLRSYRKEVSRFMDLERKVVQSSAVDVPNVEILPRGSRVGHVHREAAMKHIEKMADEGYITPTEAAQRVEQIYNAKQQSEINTMTADLPNYEDVRGWWVKRDWDKPGYYAPAFLAGLTLSLITVIIPVTVLTAEHEFNRQHPAGFAIGLICLIMGIVGFAGNVGGWIYKS